MAENTLNIGEISKICIRCSKPVGTGLRCVRCGTLSHKSCLKYIKAQFIDDYTCICCSDATLGVTGNSQIQTNITNYDNAQDSCDDNVENKIFREKIIYLEKIIKEKDDTIKFQNISIQSLQEQISLMKRVNEIFNTKTPLEIPLISQQSVEISGPTKRDEEKNSRDLTPQATVNLIKPQEIRAAIHNAQASRICEDIINSNKSMTSSQLSKRNTKPRNILVGSGGNAGNCPFKSAPNKHLRHFHITNMEVSVEGEELKKYLSQFAPDVIVHKINVRYPNDLEKGRRKLKQAENSSDLNSEFDEEAPRKRVRAKKKNL
ncbi:unnamed protein product [Psylliodes chrysocephalus]|uniref:Phorbol-ester/DAG-type domain-containing protein n=1 Tax=Psylliodes chrysocephalus TaxID=3402493 RepID=A0A9P0CIG8_9CUCU|nr:unnamed protein product [Psylliodes chrysocephala]